MSDSTDTYSMDDFSRELENPRLRAVLAPAVYHPTADRLAQICERYRAEPGWRMLGCRSGEEIVGCLGLALGDAGQATIRHIAVAPGRRGHGIGIAMIRHAVATFALTHLSAETGHEAMDFYRACGFAIQSLGELYPGTERFLCTYTTGEDGIAEAEGASGCACRVGAPFVAQAAQALWQKPQPRSRSTAHVGTCRTGL